MISVTQSFRDVDPAPRQQSSTAELLRVADVEMAGKRNQERVGSRGGKREEKEYAVTVSIDHRAQTT